MAPSAGASSKDRKVSPHTIAFTILGPKHSMSVSKASTSPDWGAKRGVANIYLSWPLPCSRRHPYLRQGQHFISSQLNPLGNLISRLRVCSPTLPTHYNGLQPFPAPRTYLMALVSLCFLEGKRLGEPTLKILHTWSLQSGPLTQHGKAIGK